MPAEAHEPGGRNPAPGRLAVVQAFLNSADLEDGWDTFAASDGLRQWAIEHDLAPSSLVVSDDDRVRAVMLREALRDALGAHSGHDADPGALRTVNTTLGRQPLGVVLDCGANAVLRPATGSAGIDRVFAQLAAIINAAHADGTWQRLRICRRHACRWAFYDASKNRSGVWCTMAICGSRTKARSYRRRRAGSESPGPAQPGSIPCRTGHHTTSDAPS